jgi:hypothetical protein
MEASSSGASSAAAAILRPLYAPISCRRPEKQQAAQPHGCAARSVYHDASRSAWLADRYLRLRAARLERAVPPFDRDCAARFVREAVPPRRAFERAVLLRRGGRVVLRDGLRRFVAVLRAVDLPAERVRAVDLRAVDLRAVDLRAVDLGAVDLGAVDLRAVDLRAVDVRAVLRDEALGPLVVRADVLRAVVLRAVVLRAAVLRPVALRPDGFRADVLLRPDVLRPDVLRPDVLRPEDAAVPPARSRRFVRARLRLFSAGLS